MIERDKFKKSVKQYKKDIKEKTDTILLHTVGKSDMEFHDYKEESLDWSWDSITGSDNDE
jgi:hypothetical protein